MFIQTSLDICLCLEFFGGFLKSKKVNRCRRLVLWIDTSRHQELKMYVWSSAWLKFTGCGFRMVHVPPITSDW